MALTISAAAPPVGGSTRQQQDTLNRLLNLYRADQSHGIAANTLAALGKQITSAAQVLGQHVTLPHAPAAGASAPAVPPPGRPVNLTV